MILRYNLNLSRIIYTDGESFLISECIDPVNTRIMRTRQSTEARIKSYGEIGLCGCWIRPHDRVTVPRRVGFLNLNEGSESL